MLNVGDIVLVHDIHMCSRGYSNAMFAYSGMQAVITKAEQSQVDSLVAGIKSDGYVYEIDLDGGQWWWDCNTLSLVGATIPEEQKIEDLESIL